MQNLHIKTKSSQQSYYLYLMLIQGLTLFPFHQTPQNHINFIILSLAGPFFFIFFISLLFSLPPLSFFLLELFIGSMSCGLAIGHFIWQRTLLESVEILCRQQFISIAGYQPRENSLRLQTRRMAGELVAKVPRASLRRRNRCGLVICQARVDLLLVKMLIWRLVTVIHNSMMMMMLLKMNKFHLRILLEKI